MTSVTFIVVVYDAAATTQQGGVRWGVRSRLRTLLSARLRAASRGRPTTRRAHRGSRGRSPISPLSIHSAITKHGRLLWLARRITVNAIEVAEGSFAYAMIYANREHRSLLPSSLPL